MSGDLAGTPVIRALNMAGTPVVRALNMAGTPVVRALGKVLKFRSMAAQYAGMLVRKRCPTSFTGLHVVCSGVLTDRRPYIRWLLSGITRPRSTLLVLLL